MVCKATSLWFVLVALSASTLACLPVLIEHTRNPPDGMKRHDAAPAIRAYPTNGIRAYRERAAKALKAIGAK